MLSGLAGCVESVSYIDRPWVPRDAKNATGDTLITDGRIAIVRLNECANPHRAGVADASLPQVKEKANPVERFGRNTVLYLRDDFGRGYIVYQGYSGIKTVWGMTHKPKESVAGPKLLHVGGEPYEVVSRPSQSMPKGGPKDPSTVRPSFVLPGTPRDYRTRLEFSISGGGSFFANDQFATQPLVLISTSPPPVVLPQEFINYLHGGYTIAPKATLNSWRYVSMNSAIPTTTPLSKSQSILLADPSPAWFVTYPMQRVRFGNSLTRPCFKSAPTENAFGRTALWGSPFNSCA